MRGGGEVGFLKFFFLHKGVCVGCGEVHEEEGVGMRFVTAVLLNFMGYERRGELPNFLKNHWFPH
jgi:hypothetical protein